MFKVNDKDTSHTVSIVNFEHVIAGWAGSVMSLKTVILLFFYCL